MKTKAGSYIEVKLGKLVFLILLALSFQTTYSAPIYSDGITATSGHSNTIISFPSERNTAGKANPIFATDKKISSKDPVKDPVKVKAVTYYSRASGNWTDPNTWSTVGCGGAAAGTYPQTTADKPARFYGTG